MKIKTEHYNLIKSKIEKLGLAKCDYARCIEALSSDPRVKDPHRRFRFDLLYAAKLSGDEVSAIYDYANDDHINTALKKIVKELYG